MPAFLPARLPPALLGLLAPMIVIGCKLEPAEIVAEIAPEEGAASGAISAADGAAALQPAGPPPDGPAKPAANRLARETSPYLLLHAHNPVDWYPWGPEAFEKARREDKPIFLSIGYSSCYWCHVMERLVFQNAEIARYMNEHFVNIKVDREERPDVDDIYMTALQLTSEQGGGWPLSMFLTPVGKPIAGGTYFPPEDAPGRPGFMSVVRQMVSLWKDERERVEAQADAVTAQLRRVFRPRPALTPVPLDRQLVEAAVSAIVQSHDSEYGGVDFDPARPQAPKFPLPTKLALLEYESVRKQHSQPAEVMNVTLDRVARGGIYDHLAGGFHRYSTDRFWHVPHFEKMLYDQAQLADVYTAAYERTGNPRWKAVVEETLDFVLRDMRGPQGGFASAIDAETDAVEGKFYVWSAAEIGALLGRDDAALFGAVYGLNAPQQFEHGYVLHLPVPLETFAQRRGLDLTELGRRLEGMRARLLEARRERPAPLLDDKVLTSWNGLMIRALAHAGRVLERSDYLAAAAEAAEFVLTRLRDDEDRLRRTFRAEQSKLNAYLDDYAFLVEGLLALHHASGEGRWLTTARELTDEQLRLFWDETGHGFFFTSNHHEELIARTRNAYDAVLPAGNSVSVRNLVRLAALTGEDMYRDRARRTLEVFAPTLQESPRSLATLALGLAEFLDAPDFAPRPATRTQAPAADIQPAAGEEPRPTAKPDPHKVDAKVYLSVDKLPPGGTCRIVLLADIAKGWHINTNPPRPDFLVPTRFTLKSKLGTQMSVSEYPPGRQLDFPGIDEPLHVYEDRVAIYGIVTVPKEAAGQTEEVQVSLSYQACSNTRCLRPMTFTLEGKLPVARIGEQVKPINQSLFPEPNR